MNWKSLFLSVGMVCALTATGVRAEEVTAETLYPVHDGDCEGVEWRYDYAGVSEFFGSVFTHKNTDGDTASTLIAQPENTAEAIVLTDTALGTISGDGFTASPCIPFLPRVLSDEAPVTLDYVVTYGNPGEGEVGMSKPYTMQRTFTLLGKESITVPAGTFECYKVNRKTDYVGENTSYTSTIWYAPEVGQIRLQHAYNPTKDEEGLMQYFPEVDTLDFVGGVRNGVSYPVNGASCIVTTDEYILHQGDTGNIYVSLFGDQAVDCYLGFFDPENDAYSLTFDGIKDSIVPIRENLSLADAGPLAFNMYNVMPLTIPANAQPGMYVLYLALTKPGEFSSDAIYCVARTTVIVRAAAATTTTAP